MVPSNIWRSIFAFGCLGSSSKMRCKVLLPLCVVNHPFAVPTLDVWMLLYSFLGRDNFDEMVPNAMLLAHGS